MRTAVPESFLVRKAMPCSGRCWPWVVLWVLGLCAISSVGCDRQEGPLPPEPVIGGDAGESPPIDHLVAARRLLKSLDYEEAADSVGKALLQNPNDGDTRFVASEIEVARGNFDVAIELAATIPIDSRLGQRAVTLQWQAMAKLGRHSDAADLLLGAMQRYPNAENWHHTCWQLLNRVGRREEASRQAEMLCQVGVATQNEMLSLVRRTESFPTVLNDGEKPEQFFDPGLGMARWFFTNLEFRKALKALEDERAAGFPTPAAKALYGRLLAETQAFEKFPRWHGTQSEQMTGLGDYWVALGTYFFDTREYSASAHALLQAVYRNPSDRVAFQRLAKVFDALGRSEDAAQYRARGILVSDTEFTAEEIYKANTDIAARKRMPRYMLDLGRPFETLQWNLMLLPSTAVQQRAVIAQQRQGFLANAQVLVMAAESALSGNDPRSFAMADGLQSLLASAESTAPVAAADLEPLAMPKLSDVAAEVGLDFTWYKDTEIDLKSIPIHESIGGGIGILDYDLDGWPDVYLGQGSGEPPTDACTRSNVLARNVAGGFDDVTEFANAVDFNYSSGIAAGDVNQDGFADLFVGSLGRNRLLINNGDGTFRDATDELGEIEDQFTTSIAVADINGDSLPDLFEAIYIEMDGAFELPTKDADGRELQPSPLKHYAESDRWYENLGDGRFQAQTISREVAKPGTSLGLIVTDFNGNGKNEVFVGNDVRANHFLVQAGNGEFDNAADIRGVANGFSGAANGCMGIAPGDYNRDGKLDLFITNFSEESANLYIQQTGSGFTDLAVRYGVDTVSLPFVGFGTKAIDLDRNGWLDLIVTNGHIFDMTFYGEDYQMAPQCLMAHGNRFESTEVEDKSGYWDETYLGRVIAAFDFDRDGDLDLLVNHLDKPLAILRSETDTDGHWIQFELSGRKSERDGIGARVLVKTTAGEHSQWVTAGDGYFCSDEAVLDFGLGRVDGIKSVQVHWPSGELQTFDMPTADQRYLIVEGEAELYQR
ncbi:CRTAC1 family protein [Rhodopirellula sp.]|nr:CRTAC1 family protein [Rhodopirellula sp.]